MRVACVHVPQFALQSLGRIDPALRGAAVAVVGAGAEPGGARPSLALHSPIVLACSRAAWALGVRLGMTAAAARFVSPELRLVAADAQAERETVRAIADALLGMSAVVDAGGRVNGNGTHLAMYCEVPSKVRGAAFGDRVVELLATFGLAVRVGIADDRFTAWVAAAHGEGDVQQTVRVDEPRERTKHARQVTAVEVLQPVSAPPVAGRRKPSGRRMGAAHDRCVVSVPRGGSAAFLAPRPLSLLAITPEVQHMLEALGVRTLGEFAALPAPSVARPLEADYQALARGESGSALRPYAPEAPICEELASGEGQGLFGGGELVVTLARRVALRLVGRARRAARLELTIAGERGERVVPVAIARAAGAQDELVALIAPVVEQGRAAVTRLRVVVAAEAVAAAPGDTCGDAVADAPVDAAIDASIDALAVALPGSAKARAQLSQLVDGRADPAGRGEAWQLIAPDSLRTERRELHRRTKRAKPRRRAQPDAQSPLFGKLDG